MEDPDSLIQPLLFALSTDVGAEGISGLAVALNLLLVLVLVVANGFFVAAEFALVAVRKSRIEALVAEGNRSAKRLLNILNNLTEYISATQLGITMASLGLGWVGEPAVVRLVEGPLVALAKVSGIDAFASGTVISTVAFTIAFSIITYVLIVFGELVPKTVAYDSAEKIAMLVALPIDIFYKIFFYPIRLLYVSGRAALRLLGLKSAEEKESSYTEEEIRHLITASHKSGHLKEEEERLINRVFEFSETTVREAMVPRTEVIAVPFNSSLEDIARAFRQFGYSRLPVYGDSLDDIKGFVHSKDVMQYFAVKPRMFKLERVLKKPSYVVDTAYLEDVLRQMQRQKFHFGFVVDEHGGVEGIITLEDLLEEIVGDISDEHDEEVNEQIREQEDGSVLLDGSLAVRDLNKRYETSLPVSESYTTLGGFLMAESGEIPKEGASVVYNGLTFTIEQVEKRRIITVRMVKTDQTALKDAEVPRS
jgi:CBS domain containing-hemolysin-like protein